MDSNEVFFFPSSITARRGICTLSRLRDAPRCAPAKDRVTLSVGCSVPTRRRGNIDRALSHSYSWKRSHYVAATNNYDV